MLIVLLFLFINRVLLKALQNPEIFSWIDELETVAIIQPAKISIVAADDKLLLLKQVMEEQKCYLDPDLTVESLARAAGLRGKELSVLINEQLGQNFFDYVNRYRIAEAQRLLDNTADPGITVLEVLYKVGFNSKSSFNTLFKKYTGLTPTAFKNKTQM